MGERARTESEAQISNRKFWIAFVAIAVAIALFALLRAL